MKKASAIIPWVLLAIGILTLLENAIACFQCPGTADESWQVFIIQNKICSWYSFFVKYLGFANGWSFLQHRFFWVSLHLLGGSLLGYSTYKRLKVQFNLTSLDAWVMSFAIPALFTMSLAIVAPSYIALNYVVGCLSLAALVAATDECATKRRSDIFAVISGTLIVQVAFIMPTNVVLFPIMLLLAYFIQKRTSIMIAVGIAFGVALFFTFICTPHEFLETCEAFRRLDFQKTDGHGIFQLIWWLMLTATDFVPVIAFGIAVSRLATSETPPSGTWGRLAYYAVIACAVVHMGLSLPRGIYAYTLARVDMFVVYAMAIALLYGHLRKTNRPLAPDMLIFTLFLLTPLCLSFGTNIEFAHRGGRYLIFALLPIWVLTRHYRSHMGNTFFAVFSAAYLIIMATGPFRHIGYSGVSMRESRCSLKEFGCRCLTSQKQLCELRKVSELTKGRNTIIGGRDSWRAAVLLKKTPISTTWYKPDNILEFLQETKACKEDSFILEYRDTFELTPKDERNISTFWHSKSVKRIRISEKATVVIFM